MGATGETIGAFELIPLIEPSLLPNGETVSTIELSGSNTLYIGTENGLILDFSHSAFEHNGPSTHLRRVKELNPRLHKAPVTFLRSASALDRLLVLCDSTLAVLNTADLSPLSSLAGASKLKGVVACCINENPLNDDPFCVQLCLAKKKQLAVISISESQIKVDRIRDMSEPVKAVGMDGSHICAALNDHYIVFNISTGTCQDLFPFEEDQIPIVTRVSKEEFLLGAPGGLGMFVTASTGMTERPPIQWMQSSTFRKVQKCIFYDPYVIALCGTENDDTGDAIVVYNIQDQKAKQTLQFNGGNAIGNFEGRLMVSSGKSVYRIQPISVQIRIESLLNNGFIEEALLLAERSHAQLFTQTTTQEDLDGTSDRCKLESSIHRTYQMAGFVQMKAMELEKAKILFTKGCLDPRELICLWPRLLPGSSSYTRCITPRPLHDIPDVNQIGSTQGDFFSRGSSGVLNKSESLNKLTDFLISFLEDLRSNEGERCVFKCEIDTALIKLYAKDQPTKLITFLNGGGGGWTDLAADYDDCSAFLTQCKRQHALGLLNLRLGKENQAFHTWAELLNSNNDEHFPGLEFFVSRLMHSSEELVWRYADTALRKDQILSVKLFTKLTSIKDNDTEASETRDQIISFLKPQYSTTYILFLEHLVLESKLQEEKYHTLLALAYLDEIRRISTAGDTKEAFEAETESKSKFYTKDNTECDIKSNSQFYTEDNKETSDEPKSKFYVASDDNNKEQSIAYLRKKFRNLIVSSSLINASFVLTILEKDFKDFHQERAFLLGRLGDHVKALKILVHDLKDFLAAEDYCDKIMESSDTPNVSIETSNVNKSCQIKLHSKTNTSKSTPRTGESNNKNSRLLNDLLEVYLDQELSKEQQMELSGPALDLLHRRANEMDPMEVLRILPDHWSIAALLPAINSMVRSKIHDRRMNSVKKHLAEAEHLNLQCEEIQLVENPIFVHENSYCMVCKKSFRCPKVSRYPNGVVLHPECVKDSSICPITGQIFKMSNIG